MPYSGSVEGSLAVFCWTKNAVVLPGTALPSTSKANTVGQQHFLFGVATMTRKQRVLVTDQDVIFPENIGADTPDAAYIYLLEDPRDKTVRYVGTTDSPRRRFIEHCNPKNHSGNKRKAAWILDLIQSGAKPVMHVLTMCKWFEANKTEKKYIRSYFEDGHPLVNKRGTRGYQ